jgi:hypothetical protein
MSADNLSGSCAIKRRGGAVSCIILLPVCPPRTINTSNSGTACLGENKAKGLQQSSQKRDDTSYMYTRRMYPYVYTQHLPSMLPQYLRGPSQHASSGSINLRIASFGVDVVYLRLNRVGRP